MATFENANLHLDITEWEMLFAFMKDKLRDVPKMVHTSYATFGFKDIIGHFQEEAAPDGKWLPLKFRKGKPLQDTGNLRKSILPSNWKSISNTGIMVFANAPYGKYHDEGTNKIPQRKFMWLSDEAKQKMAEYIANKLIGD